MQKSPYPCRPKNFGSRGVAKPRRGSLANKTILTESDVDKVATEILSRYDCHGVSVETLPDGEWIIGVWMTEDSEDPAYVYGESDIIKVREEM